jgi:hypothetical protein
MIGFLMARQRRGRTIGFGRLLLIGSTYMSFLIALLWSVDELEQHVPLVLSGFCHVTAS